MKIMLTDKYFGRLVQNKFLSFEEGCWVKREWNGIILGFILLDVDIKYYKIFSGGVFFSYSENSMKSSLLQNQHTTV